MVANLLRREYFFLFIEKQISISQSHIIMPLEIVFENRVQIRLYYN